MFSGGIYNEASLMNPCKHFANNQDIIQTTPYQLQQFSNSIIEIDFLKLHIAYSKHLFGILFLKASLIAILNTEGGTGTLNTGTASLKSTKDKAVVHNMY